MMSRYVMGVVQYEPIRTNVYNVIINLAMALAYSFKTKACSWSSEDIIYINAHTF